jgi:hypothetical protein
VIQFAIHKSMFHGILPATCIPARASASAGQFRFEANCRTKSRSVASPRPCHSFEKT